MTTTALTHLATTFEQLTAGPDPLTVTADILDGDRHDTLTITELSKSLLDRATTPHTRDTAWAHVVHRARKYSAWTVIAVGLALPGLRRTATRVRHIWPHTETDDIESEVLAGFLTALSTIDLDEPHICSRLCQKAFVVGREWARSQIYTARTIQRMYESHTPPPAYGHPDLILARAVREEIITATDAFLISETRLDKAKLAAAAASIGLSVTEVQLQRKHAEAALTEWICS